MERMFPDEFALIVPLLFNDRFWNKAPTFEPITPYPTMFDWLFRMRLLLSAPICALPPLIVTDPGPAKVKSPLSRSCPEMASMLPVVVPRFRVPRAEVKALFPAVYVLPSLIRIAPCVDPLRNAPLVPVCMTPPLEVFSVPPWIVVLTFTVLLLPVALMVPPRLLTAVVVAKLRMPPLVASSVAVLVIEAPVP